MNLQSRFLEKGRWALIAIAVGILAGTAAAFFLYSLDWATNLREHNTWLVLFLPFCGLTVGWLYLRFGSEVEGGNSLLIDEIHDPKKTVPLRMAPMILVGTVLTHLFGGSAGREGTAVQMGGSIADQLCGPLKIKPEDRRTLLMMGMSAGFGAVFGVPFAGAIFGIEVLIIGRVKIENILECLAASLVAHYVCLAWGIQHTAYAAPEIVSLTLFSVLKIAAAGAAFGLCARAFVLLMHKMSALFKKYLPYAPLRPFTGGVLVVVGFYLLGTMRFAGLGIPVIVDSLREPIPEFDFAWKTLFTTLTLASGFKGGEVTPLLFIGATLGNSLGALINLPFSLLAAVGFVAVFAGAANTPWACTVMAMEIFGYRIGAYALIGCWISFYFSSHSGIYSAQKIGNGKFHRFQKVLRKLY
ncbi:MAG: voltage-gated chloride channel family protein [Bdellovibrionales bacterium]